MKHLLLTLLTLIPASILDAAESQFPLFDYLTGQPAAKMIAYTPSGLDPRYPANQVAHKTSELKADLMVLRETFDGLILYGYNESTTPRILALAAELKYRAVLLGIWEIKSSAELDGVVKEVNLYHDQMTLGVLVGNEGVLFGRYEKDDLTIAFQRMRNLLPADIPLATSEPHASYKDEFFLSLGDFLAPNIHPVFDAKELDAKASAAWSREKAMALAEKSGKPVLLKETGFPHGGEAKFTPESQKQFWQSYLEPGFLVRLPDKPDIWVSHCVAFEAFDLPWKSEASGLPIEKNWGLFSTERKAYPVEEVWKDLKQ